MPTNSLIEQVRRRWTAERPFEGHAKDSLFRKLHSQALREEIREQVQRELEIRARDPLSV